MNQTGLNIFDLLLLGPVEQNQAVSGGITGEQPDGQLFGNLLDSLLNVKKSDQFPGMDNPIENNSEMNFPNILNENITEKNSDHLILLLNPKSEVESLVGTGEKTIEKNQLQVPTIIGSNDQEVLESVKPNLNYKNSDGTILQDVSVNETELLNGSIGDNKEQTIIKNAEPVNVKNFNNALAELMPLNTGTNKQINELLNQIPVTLDSGSYEIIDSDIKDDSLVLSVISESNSEPIKISLPLEQLKSVLSNSELQSQRVNLGTQNQQKLEFENLIRNLNLKELTVHNNNETLKSEQSGISNSKNNIINIEITAEGSGQIQFIKGKLLKSSVRATQKNNQIISKGNISGEEKDLQNSSRDIVTEKNEPAFNKQFFTKNQNYGREQLLNLANNKSQNIVNDFSHPINTNVISANTNDIDKLIELNRTASPKNESHPVKYNLPDDIRTALKPNGKSVNILIEPENLGPARLKLVLNNQTLRAELIVQSSQAKTVVESSLSQLIEQLNRSDIKVEFIDVNVNSENNQGQFAQRHPQWSRKSFSNNLENLTDDALAYLPTDEITGIAQGSYVNSEGVNVLA